MRYPSPALASARSRTGSVLAILLVLSVSTGCQNNRDVAAKFPTQGPSIRPAKLGGDSDLTRQVAAATGIQLVPISAGTFLMGSPLEEAGHVANEGPQTKVTLTRDFFLGATVVTQAQWTALMGVNPSVFKGDDRPVERVSWNDAIDFCGKLTERERAAGRLPAGFIYTLPTEAQWEYACRAGTTGPRAGDLDAMVWYTRNSGNTTHPVATKQPNAWGLYDMNGNVMQWCLDKTGPYPGGAVVDPVGSAFGTSHILRGGSWNGDPALCRSASRVSNAPAVRYNRVGFRVALCAVTADQVAPPPVSGPDRLEHFSP